MLSVVIITLNEESNIRDCIACVKWADEIVVVDSGSEDDTLSEARALGVTVYENVFRDFATQKNFALDKATHPWVLMLDADERVSKPLRDKVQAIVSSDQREAVYAIYRETYFFGKRLKYSGVQNDFPIRLLPKGKAHLTQPVHEEVVTELPVVKLSEPIIHYSTKDFKHYKLKLERYLPFEQTVLEKKGTKKSMSAVFVRPLGKFVKLWILDRGIFDGWTGLQYAVLSSYYVFLKYWKYCKTGSA